MKSGETEARNGWKEGWIDWLIEGKEGGRTHKWNNDVMTHGIKK